MPTQDCCTHRLVCHFSGRVQGVGFRYTVKNIALQYNVGGYVRNLPDGRVELVMEGPDTEMDHLVADVNDRMRDYVQNVDRKVLPASNEFNRFSIQH
jgi:acylphosphatase